MEINAAPYMASQEHRDNCLSILRTTIATTEGHVTIDQMLAIAGTRAQLAIYEGLYELLGDGSRIDSALTNLRLRV